MNTLQTNSHDDRFYYHLDFHLKNENRLTIDTSCIVVPPTDYFQTPFNSNDGLFYCPVPLSSISAESVFSFSLDTPSPDPQMMFLPSLDGSTFSFDYLFDPLPLMSPRSLSPSDVYDTFAHRSGSKEPSDHASATKTKRMLIKDPKSSLSPKALKPFVCKVCSRPFARKHDLQRHSRVHTGVKPYSCLHCKKAFIRTDALKHHLRMVEACRTSPIIQAMKESGERRYRNL